jgi:hypothetical protein
MTAIAPSCTICVHVGEIAVRMISAPNSNSRLRSSQTPKRAQTALRRPSRGGLKHHPHSLNSTDRDENNRQCFDHQGEISRPMLELFFLI